MPIAMVAAFTPLTPPPITTTSAGAVPGTPPINTPRPPADRIRWYSGAMGPVTWSRSSACSHTACAVPNICAQASLKPVSEMADPGAGVLLDDDLVAPPSQFGHSCRGHRDPVLVTERSMCLRSRVKVRPPHAATTATGSSAAPYTATK